MSAVMAVGLTVALTAKRGWAVGAVAALVYGGLAIATLRWDRLLGWSARHPLLDSAFFCPLVFLALAYITRLPTATCLAIALAAGAAFVGLRAVLRARGT